MEYSQFITSKARLRLRFALPLVVMLLQGCMLKPEPAASDSALLTAWVKTAAADIGQPQLAQHPEQYRLQLLFAEAEPDSVTKTPIWRQQQYRADTEYLYPASTVKLAVAALALEYAGSLAAYGVSIDSVMTTEPLLPGDKPVLVDASSATGKPSIRHYVKKILLVSDNEAYNRLYELLGQTHINNRLHALGFDEAQIIHRLERPLSVADNRKTNAIVFYDPQGKVLYRQPAREAPPLTSRPYTPVGQDYLKNGQAQGQPLDFSQKNLWKLSHIQRLVQMIMLPQTLPAGMQLQLSAADRQFLQQQMAQLVTESQDPAYDPQQYWPTYVKFLVYGSEKNARLDPALHIHNKVGDAYGFLLDGAYIRDDCSGRDFLLSAALYVNADGVLNDDHYDYETIGLPFLKRIGELAVAHVRSQQEGQTQNGGTSLCKTTALAPAAPE